MTNLLDLNIFLKLCHTFLDNVFKFVTQKLAKKAKTAIFKRLDVFTKS